MRILPAQLRAAIWGFAVRGWLCRSSGDTASPWVSLRSNQGPLSATEAQTLWFRTRRQLRPGWYLFAIRHRGDNLRATGWLHQGSSRWRQGRPMFPMRRRFRVVRVAHRSVLTLELQRVQHPLRIRELWLVRLPAFEAWRRIRRRLQKPLGGHLPRRPPLIWRAYNQLLAAQANQHGLVRYERWLEVVERPWVSSLAPLQESDISRFHQHTFASVPQFAPPATWVVVLSHNSRLTPWALQAVAAAISQMPEALLLYGDEDQIGADGERHSPQFKPAWNRELFWGDPGYSHCWFIEADLWNQWLDQPVSSAPTCCHALVVQLLGLLQGREQCIRHLPFILSHRSGSQELPSLAASELQDLLRQQLGAQAPRISRRTSVRGYQLHWPLPAGTLLSVVIPTRDRPELLRACLEAIDRYPAGCSLELVVADNDSAEPAMLALLDRFEANSSLQRRQIVVRTPGPFNYSAINNLAIQSSRGSVILLLNNDVEFLHEGWGLALAANAMRPDIGCVGAQLLYPDRRVQHGGVILGIGGIAGHAHHDFEGHVSGYHGRLQLVQELSAVTAACLAISRDHWQELGGLDERRLAVNYNDVDLCLRARQRGWRNLYLPQVRALHHESKSRGRPEGAAFRQWRREWAVMEKRWGHLLQKDPAYHPHLSLEAADWTLAIRRDAPLIR